MLAAHSSVPDPSGGSAPPPAQSQKQKDDGASGSAPLRSLLQPSTQRFEMSHMEVELRGYDGRSAQQRAAFELLVMRGRGAAAGAEVWWRECESQLARGDEARVALCGACGSITPQPGTLRLRRGSGCPPPCSALHRLCCAKLPASGHFPIPEMTLLLPLHCLMSMPAATVIQLPGHPVAQPGAGDAPMLPPMPPRAATASRAATARPPLWHAWTYTFLAVLAWLASYTQSAYSRAILVLVLSVVLTGLALAGAVQALRGQKSV